MSAGTVTITLRSDAQAVLRKLAAFPPAMAARVARALDNENQNTVGHIVATKLTNAGPRYLNRRSGTLGGRLRNSPARVAGLSIQSQIGTNVRYAGIHEFGFDGTVQVRAYQRRYRAIRRDGSEATGTATVRPHGRRVKMPARRMIQDGIKERVPAYREAISNAIVAGWNEEVAR